MYRLKQSTAEDAEFAYHALKTTMREFAMQTWGVWLDEEAKKDAAHATQSGKVQIIYVDEVKVGTLQYVETESEIIVKQLYLLPAYQNQGIGGAIMNDLQKRAIELKLPIELSVLQVNSAKEFYLKKGFFVKLETAERIRMRYEP